jgi:hypothetical protein
MNTFFKSVLLLTLAFLFVFGDQASAQRFRRNSAGPRVQGFFVDEAGNPVENPVVSPTPSPQPSDNRSVSQPTPRQGMGREPGRTLVVAPEQPPMPSRQGTFPRSGGTQEQQPMPKNGVRVDRELISQLKAKAVKTLVIGSNSLVLEAELWRNFMPSGGRANDSSLVSTNTLTCKNTVKIPDNIRMVKQYVIFKDSIWVSDYTGREEPNLPAHQKQKTSLKGPKWDDVQVDVISQILDSKTNQVHYLKVENVPIERVW